MKARNLLCLATALSFFSIENAYSQSKEIVREHQLVTRWAREIKADHVLTEYPRPQLVRNNWVNLNGSWDYAIVPKDTGYPKKMDGKILVPFPLESFLSGVQKTLSPDQSLCYSRTFEITALSNMRTLLHFGAVDYEATVNINGQEVGKHEGGYTSFTFDITDALVKGNNKILLKVNDPSNRGVGPHGKQVLNPANIYYTPSSGIWQTVWLEQVPQAYINDLTITPDIDKKQVRIKVQSSSVSQVTLIAAGQVVKGITNQDITLSLASPKLWSPSSPYLYDLKVKMGEDEVKSYFGMRKISVDKDVDGVERIFLNNKPYFNLGTLDQGYWPDGLYTAPTDEALSFDIKAIKAMGFNTIRKHIKVEPARWYYWADKLGMLVWQDMVNPNQSLPQGAKQAFEKQSAEILSQLHNYPSITTWVLFNEKWGAYDQQRLTRWIKATDPSRLVNGHSGEFLYVNEKLRSPSPNAYVDADITDVHAYPDPMISIKQAGKAQVVGEFGGIGVFVPDHQWNSDAAWGYINEKPAGFAAKYKLMNQHLQLLQRQGLSASIYTQPYDVEGEQNGIMTYDREIIKIPLKTLRDIHHPLNGNSGKIPEVSLKDADLSDPASVYAKQLQRYIDGERGQDFLKKLAILATQAGDKTGARMASSSYIQGLKSPLTTEEIGYIMRVTSSLKDSGFEIIRGNVVKIDSGRTDRPAESKLMSIIYYDLIAPYVSGSNAKPDWDVLAQSVNQYGKLGEEILLRAKTIYLLNRKDYVGFAKAADDYVRIYNQYISTNELNQFAWTAFENLNDTLLLLKASEWSKFSLRDREDPMFLDTQANLLYKAGRKAEAIIIQEKAVQISGDPELKANLEKMKGGR
jgi:hypothetical protein